MGAPHLQSAGKEQDRLKVLEHMGPPYSGVKDPSFRTA